MRYGPDKKEQTRNQIVHSTANLVRRDGISATGVASLMRAAGLTQGGFYSHFESKEALVREVMLVAVGQTYDWLRLTGARAGEGPAALRAIIRAYLSTKHVDRIDRGCAVAALGTELVRESARTRAAVSDAAGAIVDLIAAVLPAGTEDCDRLARSVFGLMSGVVQLARLTTDPSERVEILEGGRSAALALCGMPEPRGVADQTGG